MYIAKKTVKNIPEDLDLVFNVEMYRLFKKTLLFFRYGQDQKIVEVEEFTSKMHEYFEDIKLENQKQ